MSTADNSFYQAELCRVDETSAAIQAEVLAELKTDKQWERFESIRTNYLKTDDRMSAFRSQMWDRYRQSNPPRSWMTRGETAKLEAIRRAQDKAISAMTALLDDVGGRCWHSHAPVVWIMRELTYEDATTTGSLSVVPPAGYGSTAADMERFARAVES